MSKNGTATVTYWPLASVNPDSSPRLDSIGKAADARGVTGTPTVFVNNKMLNADQLTPDGLAAVVGAE